MYNDLDQKSVVVTDRNLEWAAEATGFSVKELQQQMARSHQRYRDDGYIIARVKTIWDRQG